MKEDSKELALKYKTKKIIDLACPVQICAARFSPCGNVLAAACFDGSVRRWDSSTDKFTELTPITGHNGWVQAIAFFLFRFFDAAKPWPINRVDQYFKKNWVHQERINSFQIIKQGFGIMIDDLIAALFTILIVILGIRWLT